MNPVHSLSSAERLRRWRLLLGGSAADSVGCALTGADIEIDRALASLYGAGPEGGNDLMKSDQRKGGSGASQPGVARWLGDIRKYFPSSVVRVLQKDALERLKLNQLLLEPELLEAVEPDVHLVANLLALRGVIPASTRETARIVVRKVVDELMRRLQEPLRSAIGGALNRAERNRRPRFAEMDWPRTIRANLRHYQAEYQSIVPETRIGFGRKRQHTQRQVILCIDQSGSMAASVVYSSICGAVMASLPAVKTHLVVFDTAVVDLTEHLDDPVELLFGTQLGGGTDINRAVGYCQSLIQDPANTILVLISDLFEGGVAENLLRRANDLVQSGVQFIALLALADSGAASYDRGLAAQLALLDVPSFACTPDLFPDLMAAAIKRENIAQWAARHELVTARPG
ncbi:MAG: VWA domain-containing protein [Candidatus Competibacteraceae bacterium]|nr:MAG: VWA domain-containing protein [Candidatus Competibacteraceae bacterium]